MSDQSVAEPIRGTVYVGRKLSDKDYGSFDFGVHFPVEFNQDQSALEQTDAVVAAFEAAQEIIKGRTAPIVALVTEAVVNRPATSSAPRAQRSSGAPNAPTVSHFCETCKSVQEMYDNRAKIADGTYKPKAPKLKCKACKSGVWELDAPAPSDEEAF